MHSIDLVVAANWAWV